MDKKYLAKIIAKDSQGLKLISACCFKAKVKIEELKYLKKNQIFLIFLHRFKLENEKNKHKINYRGAECSYQTFLGTRISAGVQAIKLR